jgi:hypothetical protein
MQYESSKIPTCPEIKTGYGLGKVATGALHVFCVSAQPINRRQSPLDSQRRAMSLLQDCCCHELMHRLFYIWVY